MPRGGPRSSPFRRKGSSVARPTATSSQQAPTAVYIPITHPSRSLTTIVEGGPSPHAQTAAVPFSLDGRGGADTTPRTKAAPRYVHYRLYAKDGPLDSHNPIYCNNGSIGRILSRSVPPPRTAASLKRYLCRTEGFEEPDNCALYLSLSDKAPLEDSTPLPLREDRGPGSRECDPMVLVVDIPAAGKRSAMASMVQPTERRDEEPRYVYYRVYDENGEVVSKTSFDETDTSLGRIDTFSVSPPRNFTSLKCRLFKVEELSDDCDIQIFEDEDSSTAMDDGGPITLNADTYPGIIEDKPMAIVSRAQKAMSATQSAITSKQFKTNTSFTGWGPRYPDWHSYAAGEVFQTDGILLTRYAIDSDFTCYAAVNSSGKKGYIHEEYATFI